MDIERLKEIRDLPWTGCELANRLHDLVTMLPEIIERLTTCRNCKNYVPQDQWTETNNVGGIIDVYDPAHCSKKLSNFKDYDSSGLNKGAGTCVEFEFE